MVHAMAERRYPAPLCERWLNVELADPRGVGRGEID